jgi:hypothetical protein
MSIGMPSGREGTWKTSTPLRVLNLLAFDFEPKLFHKAADGSSWLIEGLATDYLSWFLVGNAEDHFASALVGERRTVGDEFLEMEVVLGFLEFEVLILVAIHPRLERFERPFHSFKLRRTSMKRK